MRSPKTTARPWASRAPPGPPHPVPSSELGRPHLQPGVNPTGPQGSVLGFSGDGMSHCDN